jgi:hypothetical protein
MFLLQQLMELFFLSSYMMFVFPGTGEPRKMEKQIPPNSCCQVSQATSSSISKRLTHPRVPSAGACLWIFCSIGGLIKSTAHIWTKKLSTRGTPVFSLGSALPKQQWESSSNQSGVLITPTCSSLFLPLSKHTAFQCLISALEGMFMYARRNVKVGWGGLCLPWITLSRLGIGEVLGG